MKLLILLLTILLIFPLTAAATEYYVDKNRAGARDSNAGTNPAAPWATIGKCANTIRAGDRCNVAPGGVYDERVTETTDGTAVNRLVYRALSGSPRPKVRAFTISSADYVTIEGFEITNQGMPSGSSDILNSVQITGANTGVTVLNNYIHHTNVAAIGHGSSRFLTIRGNQISNVGTSVSVMGGHAAFLGLYGQPNSDVLIEENTVSYASDYLNPYGTRYVYRNNVLGPAHPLNPIHIDGVQANGITTNSLMEGNVSIDNASSDNHLVLLHSEGSNGWIIRHNLTYRSKGMISLRYSDNTSVYNNTFVDNYDYYPSNYQVYAGNSSVNNVFLNNIWYRSVSPTGGIYLVESGSSISRDYDLTFGTGDPNELHDVVGNPRFVNAAGGDFHIQRESPARDAGGPLTTVRSNDSGNGATLFVGNVSMFQDGWAGAQKDWIAIGSVDNMVQISSINRNNNSIVLASPARRNPGDPVWLYKNSRGEQVLHGLTADIGAFEYIPPRFSIDQTSSQVRFTGSWKEEAGRSFTGLSARLGNAAGSRASFTFVGDSVTWISYRSEWSGIAKVYVDGLLKAELDLFAPSARPGAEFTQNGLPWGSHTITIEVTGRKHAASKAAWVWVDGFEYTGLPLASPLTMQENDAERPAAPGISLTTPGRSTLQVGFAEWRGTASAAQAGFAILANRRQGILISETAIPGSHLIQNGRIFAEISQTVNTGIAIANPSEWDASVSFYITDRNGMQVNQGSFSLPAHTQLARFLTESPFNAPAELSGSLTFSANSPLTAVALRSLTNERSEFLVTALPIAEVDAARPAPLYVPHFADGGGWSTQFVLVNPTDSEISGNLEFLGHGGSNSAEGFSVMVDGRLTTSIVYNIPPRSSRSYSTMGYTSDSRVGAAVVTPADSDAAPAAIAILNYRNAGITVGITGVPAMDSGNVFRVYVENTESAGVRTGLALMNTSGRDEQIDLELIQPNGSPSGMKGSIAIPSLGHRALFLNQIPGFEAIPASFKGILRVSSTHSGNIAVVGLRGRLNERSDFLATAIPAMNGTEVAQSRIYFPHVVDGDGYTTQFITFGGFSFQPGGGNLAIYGQSGTDLNLDLR